MDSQAVGGTPWRLMLLFRAILAGTIASSAMLFTFLAAYAGAGVVAALLPADRSALGVLGRWLYGLTHNVFIDTARPNLYLALAIYFAGGVGWAILYAWLFRWRPSAAPWQRGFAFALVPWAFSLLVFLPLVGGGVLGLALGAGPLPILGNFILHVVYGVTLGTVHASERAEDVTVTSTATSTATGAASAGATTSTAASAWANRGAEVGAGSGLVLGALTALVAWLVGAVSPAAEQMLSALNPLAALLAIVCIGGALGMLVGSFVGLSTRAPLRR